MEKPFEMTAQRLVCFRTLFLLSWIYLSLTVSLSQEPSTGPLTEEGLLSLVSSSKTGALPVNRVVELIQERGLAFSVTDVFLFELELGEADVAIVQTLRQMRSQGKDFVPTPTEPAGAPSPAEASVQPGKPPTEESWPHFLEAVRAKAMDYTEQLPNFICTQITQRFARFFPGGWREYENYVAELSYYDQKEHYKILTIGNQIKSDASLESLSGTWSTGEFGSSLRALFDPKTKASFRLEGVDQTNGRETVRVGYQVPKETSGRSISYRNERTVVTAYRGRCWVDPESFQVVRLEDKALSIPEGFPITRAEGSVDYDLAEIAGGKYWLPIRAEVMLVEGGAKLHMRNLIEFKRYRKFEAEVKISPE